MPYSNITKKALAMAMKELIEQIPFSKISVSDICEKCGMNRKSFYYHFKDKYDLVNWIFDVEFFQAVHVRDYFLQFSRYRHFTNLNIIIFQYHCTDIHRYKIGRAHV